MLYGVGVGAGCVEVHKKPDSIGLRNNINMGKAEEHNPIENIYNTLQQ